MFELTASVHKGTCASAHLGHNRRSIFVPHADTSRANENIAFVDIPIETAYDILFGDALKEYNQSKKPSRQIKDYYQHIQDQYEKGEQKLQVARSSGASKKEQARIKSSYPKPFYELIISLGNSTSYDGSFRCGGENSQFAVETLKEYMSSFQARNPHLFVFSAHLHNDELGVPHIHLDYIPFCDEPSSRGLPVRVSENGAFRQQHLTSGETGDIGAIAFQNQERRALGDIAIKHGIALVDGKHSKKHLRKEEYILNQEKAKNKEHIELIDSQARELLEYQSEFATFVENSDRVNSFAEHIENIELRQQKADFDEQQSRTKKLLSDNWKSFNDFTSQFFDEYKSNKAMLWSELQDARRKSFRNKKKVQKLLSDITDGNDLLIVKLAKLVMLIVVSVGNTKYEKQVEELQQANNLLKQQARNVMEQSHDVSDVLREKDIENIEIALKQYENALADAIEYVNKATMGQLPERNDAER